MKLKITKTTVDKLQKGETVWDTEVKGFAVRYQTRDKVYYLKTNVNGRQRWISIGQHGSPWTVETARDKARSLLGQKADGASIAEMRKEKGNLPTVAELAERYLAEHAKPFKKAQSYENDEAKLVNHVLCV
jgi:Arm DNA-binding domain